MYKTIFMKYLFLIISVFYLLKFTDSAFSQKKYLLNGNPFVTNFTSYDYNAHSQNFSIIQDSRGVMYFGNFAGVLEYDGSFWRTIQTDKMTKVSSLAKGKDGKIYVGARGEIGFLAPLKEGQLKFHSLMPYVKSEDKNFFDVLFCHSNSKGVYFITEKIIFFWSSGKLSKWEISNSVISAFMISEVLFFQDKKEGLKTITENGKIENIPGGEQFIEASEITEMIKINNSDILIATKIQGLFIKSGKSIQRFRTEADEIFTKCKISCAVRLNNNDIALGTERGGIAVISESGKHKFLINKKSGLQDENVNKLFVDRMNMLWATLNNGLSLIEVPSPLTFINDETGLKGSINDILYQNDVLYFATYQGLYYLDSQSKTFNNIPEILSACWSLLPVGNNIIAATSEGIFFVENKNAKSIDNHFSLKLLVSAFHKDKYFAGTTGGLLSFEFRNKNIQDVKIYPEIPYFSTEILEDTEGNIWSATPANGIIRLGKDLSTVTNFDTTKGLPDMLGNHINFVDGLILATTQKGLLKYEKEKFIPYELFISDSTNDKVWLSKIIQDSNGRLWSNSGNETNISRYIKKGSDKYCKDQIPFLQIIDFVVWKTYPDPNGIIWFGGPQGLIRYDDKAGKNYNSAFNTLIRKVTVNGDSVLFYGMFYDKEERIMLQQTYIFVPVLSYKKNSLTFEFSSPDINAKGKNLYSYFLEGYSEKWSEWSNESIKEFSNLTYGNYIFKVKSKNIFNRIGTETIYKFSITKPWFKTWWMFVFYILLFFATLIVFVRIRSRKLIKEKCRLEELIKERTSEVVKQKDELEHQSEELALKNDELEKINLVVKSINSEIHFNKLLETILTRTAIIKAVERATALMLDKDTGMYKFKAAYGWDASLVKNVQLTLEQSEEIYLKTAEEIFEDVFYINEIKYSKIIHELDRINQAKSMIVVVININNKVIGFLLLENTNKINSFDKNDFNLLKNLKEHIISAFIKTTLLENLQFTLEHLEETQEELIRQEKLASIGQLTKGIVDRVLNPLNYINNFSLLTNELVGEITEILTKIKESIAEDSYDDLLDVAQMISSNVMKINEHGTSATRIIKGMEKLLKERSTELVVTDINVLVESNLEIALQEVKKEYKNFNADIKTEYDPKFEKMKILPAEFGSVIVNMVNNACYSVYEKSKITKDYIPEICIFTKFSANEFELIIRDNGKGIPAQELKQLFSPFFTTKPTAKGTGLGLYLCQDIVKSHKGEIKVNSKEGEFTEFIIIIPNLDKTSASEE
ncbi:MAG: hypothetical protein A2275_09045 [Bacteroidetes bacterium RIFOXYA12_FULL_35_11]|nr:MAG: hypothetical protein A2X01_00300 [Bacteroidetes bacterium GWF2_35_48]OFY80865.1 MAG: hypothetical protein A2275_09045 [Bacteroidetes bacterium RIFOXYA12_FULL_35_11]OFY94128.1 MAG: hypothetical protein A2491_15735 [Bacteroidetes bacterium RIFOXYC12_FULL_35_7]HBX51683.1 hypothetical protein [Bacteroidales bacterium]